MYPDNGDGGGGSSAPAPDYGYDGGDLKSKLLNNFEGFIPLILIIIIGFVLGARFGVFDSNTPLIGPFVPGIGGQDSQIQMLIIGSPSSNTLDVLNDNEDIIKYRIRSAAELERNPLEQLAQYKIIMLDQTGSSSKEVSRTLGRALEKWVKAGNKLIVISNSGVQRPNTYDVVGWEATFGDIVPVSCERQINNVPSCLPGAAITVQGKVVSQDFDHRIMKGIEVAPAEENLSVLLTVFDVDPVGNEVAYVESSDGRRFTAIVEARIFPGRVLYFNYDIGKTRGIFENTLEYLR
jgi:hypothetical protein